MTSEEVALRLREEVDAYEYPHVEDSVGTFWTPERVAAEVALLRESLVEPSPCILHVYEHPEETVWLVATDGDVAVYLDEARSKFGLGGLEADGSIRDWGVYGDLVGTFMAR
jgi:hypothetical protein